MTTKRLLTLGVGVVVALLGAVTVLSLGAMFMFTTMMPPSASAAGLGSCAVGQADVTATGWANPLEGQITSPYGPRGLDGFHEGTDVAGVPEGTPFYSASAGTVRAAYGTGGPEGNGDGGHGIIIDIGGGTHLWYWHAQAGSTVVHAGDTVRPGQMLARVGNTGNSHGAHLHFQVMVNGTAVDPQPYMRARGVEIGTGKAQAVTAIQASQASAPPTGGSLTATRTDGQTAVIGPTQMANIARVVARGKAAGVGDKAILVAVVTVLQESKGWIYANLTVPESMGMSHDRTGSDHDSVGLFQQRPSQGWGGVGELMNVEISADRFWGITPGLYPAGLKQTPGWEKMSVSEAAQTVQHSAFPDAYGAWEPVAREVIARSGGAAQTVCTGSGNYGAGQALPATGTDSEVRARVIAAAKEGLGKPYVWGGTSPEGWDCSGYVQWVMTKAGISGVPRTEQWVFGKRTFAPEPGDLVVQIPDGQDHWSHVGIYAGGGMMYSALNPGTGTLLHPVDWNPGSAYFTMVGK